MRIKLPQNRFQPQPPIEVNKKQSNIKIQHQPIQQQQTQPKTPEIIPKVRSEPNEIVINEGQKHKALKFREKQLNQEVVSRREKMRQNGDVGSMIEGFEEGENGGNYNDIMNKISMMDIPRQYKMNPDEVVSKFFLCGEFLFENLKHTTKRDNFINSSNLIIFTVGTKCKFKNHQ